MRFKVLLWTLSHIKIEFFGENNEPFKDVKYFWKSLKVLNTSLIID